MEELKEDRSDHLMEAFIEGYEMGVRAAKSIYK